MKKDSGHLLRKKTCFRHSIQFEYLCKISGDFDGGLIIYCKGRLRATIFKSAETAHLVLLCYFGDAIGWAVSAEKKMVAIGPWVDLDTSVLQPYF